MKKSEMVDKIGEYLYSEWSIISRVYPRLAWKIGEELVSLIEESGMLPPLNFNNKKPNFFEGKEHGFTVENKWEEE